MSEYSRTEKYIGDLAKIAFDHMVKVSTLVGEEQVRPSTIYRPALTQDGNAWLAVYGDFPTGVVGCGDTPAAAMADFDAAWVRPAQLRTGDQA